MALRPAVTGSSPFAENQQPSVLPRTECRRDGGHAWGREACKRHRLQTRVGGHMGLTSEQAHWIIVGWRAQCARPRVDAIRKRGCGDLVRYASPRLLRCSCSRRRARSFPCCTATWATSRWTQRRANISRWRVTRPARCTGAGPGARWPRSSAALRHSPPVGAEWYCCDGTPRAWWSSPTLCGCGSSDRGSGTR